MPHPSPSPVNRASNEAIGILNRSLAHYLHSARPFVGFGDSRDERIVETLEQIVADQQRLIDRIAAIVLEQGGRVDLGEYPMEFTGLHDLSADYLVKQLIARQRRDLAALQGCVEVLRSAPLPRALVEEAVGAAKGHLELLEELSQNEGPKLAVVG